MNDVRGWLIDAGDGVLWLTMQQGEASEAPKHGCTVTPLVPAPPEGAPTWRELADALRDARLMIGAARPDAWDSDVVEHGVNEGDWQAARMRDSLDALLSRIPKDTER